VLPKKNQNWSLARLQQPLGKTGGRLVKRARYDYDWLLLTEGHLTRQRFGNMLRRISALSIPTNSQAGETAN
jgi:hypothetical protein